MSVKVKIEAPYCGNQVRVRVLSEEDDVLVDLHEDTLRDAVIATVSRFRTLQEETLLAMERLGIRIHTEDDTLPLDGVPEVLPS